MGDVGESEGGGTDLYWAAPAMLKFVTLSL